MLEKYAEIAGHHVVEHLRQLAKPLAGLRLVHINSTKAGGGVAEILHKMIPLMRELGLDVQWEVISGEPRFYECTKGFHNAMQGKPVNLTNAQLRHYEETNRACAADLESALKEADVVFVHDPQPAALIASLGDRKGKWVWRCHIYASHPFRPVWRYLRNFVKEFDASIFSIAPFSQRLPHPVYLIAPSIDPLHEKNIQLPNDEVEAVYGNFHIDPERPMVLQVSRFDRFKDPVGLIHAYRIVKRFVPTAQLVLAGGGASDDPEGDAVLNEVRTVAAEDPDIHVLLLPGDAHRTINALQRAADIVVQKSLREGFGLTVTEAMWKQKPVIGGTPGAFACR